MSRVFQRGCLAFYLGCILINALALRSATSLIASPADREAAIAKVVEAAKLVSDIKLMRRRPPAAARPAWLAGLPGQKTA